MKDVKSPSRTLNPVTRYILGRVVTLGRKVIPKTPPATLQPVVAQEKSVAQEKTAALARERTRQLLAETATKDEPVDAAPDVFLDIPTVKVDEIKLNVEQLDAKVALHAELANLVRIDVGAEVGVAKVDLDIKGVEAQALLKVRLKPVYQILARALETLDRNPDLLSSLLRPVGQAVGELGREAGRALAPGGALDETVRNVGGTAREALAPGGPVANTLEDVGETAKGVTAPRGLIGEAVRGVSAGVGQVVQGETHETEQERRHYHEEGRHHEHTPPPPEKKSA